MNRKLITWQTVLVGVATALVMAAEMNEDADMNWGLWWGD